MPLSTLARLTRDLEEGLRSAGNYQQALDAYQQYLVGEAQATAELEPPADDEVGQQSLAGAQQIFEWFWEASELLRSYAQSRSPQHRKQAMELAYKADSELRDLIYNTYARATRSIYAS